MALALWRQRLCHQSVQVLSESSSYTRRPRDSSSVMETFWRRRRQDTAGLETHISELPAEGLQIGVTQELNHCYGRKSSKSMRCDPGVTAGRRLEPATVENRHRPVVRDW